MALKVCVIGAGGAIGSRLVQQLVEQGFEVTAVVRKLSSAVRIGRYPIAIKVADLLSVDEDQFANILSGQDAVIDCTYSVAADTQQSIVESEKMAQLIVAACIEMRIKSVIHFGTIAVYPKSSAAVNEAIDCVYSGNSYADGKLAAQQIFLSAANEDFCPLILQLPIVIGPYMGWTTSPISQLDGKTLVMPDDISGDCNVVYIDDVISSVVTALTRQWNRPEIVLLSSPRTMSWLDFYRAHARLNTEFELLVVSRAEYQQRQQQLLKVSRPWAQFKYAIAADGDLRQLILRQWGIRTIYNTVKRMRGQPAMEQIKAGLEKGKPPVNRRPQTLLPQHLLELFDTSPSIDSSKAQKLFGKELTTDFDSAMDVITHWLRWSHLI